jgi:hypothetical protein
MARQAEKRPHVDLQVGWKGGFGRPSRDRGRLVCTRELELDYFRRLPRARLEGAFLGRTFGRGSRYRMPTHHARSFHRAIGSDSHLDLHRAGQIQLLRELRDQGLHET